MICHGELAVLLLQEAARDKARALEKAQEDLEIANVEIENERKKLEAAKARAKVCVLMML